MKQPSFVIASTGRSGSGYISKLLRECGINCGHEEWFVRNDRRKKTPDLDGDSSVWSIPHLKSFDGIIVHQVRNPLDVLSSLWAGREEMQRAKDVWGMRTSFMPNRTGDLLRDFMGMMVLMNDRIANHSTLTYRIEDVSSDVLMMQFLSIRIGHRLPKGVIIPALEKVSTTYNRHNTGESLTWDELPESTEKELLINQAKKYGYL